LGKCRIVGVMGDISTENLPDHLLRIEFWVIRRKKEKGEPRVLFQRFLYGFGMMESDIVENHDNAPPRIPLPDQGKECLKSSCVSGFSDLSGEYAAF